MTFKFRSRVFLYLLLLLVLFVASQAAIYLTVELVHSLGNPYENMDEGLEEVVQALGLTLLLVPPWAAAAWLISRWMIRPLHVMAETAKRIRGGELTERIETGSMPDDETRSLAETVNAAFDGYAGVLRRLERFSGDAAHQLRNPLAAMRSMGEVALSRERSAEDYREALETMLGELDRLTRIVEQLLQLSRLEAGALQEQYTRVGLAGVVEQVRQIYQPVADERGVGLEVAAAAEPALQGSEELVVQLLGNLVDNALRHTPSGGRVRIEAGENPGGGVKLTVADGGPGIPEAYAEAVFDRFAQVPGAEGGRAGLGLPLAAEIARVHGGALRLVNPGQPGARFEFCWPGVGGGSNSSQT